MRVVIGHARRHAVGYLALFVALSGSAYAINTVRSADVVDNSLQSQDIQDYNLASLPLGGLIATGGLQTQDLRPGSVETTRLRDWSVTGPKLVDGAVSNTKLGPSSVSGDKLASNSVDHTKIGIGAVYSSEIRDGSVLEPDLGTGQVTQSKLGPQAVTQEKLAPWAVTQDKLAPQAVQRQALSPGAVGAGQLGETYLAGRTVTSSAAGYHAIVECSGSDIAFTGGYEITDNDDGDNAYVRESRPEQLGAAGVVNAWWVGVSNEPIHDDIDEGDSSTTNVWVACLRR